MRPAVAFLLASLVSVLVQQQPEPPRHDKYAADAHAYCWNPKTAGSQRQAREHDTHAHRCECRLMCQVGPDNEVVGEQETSNCELYCTRSHCTCHQGEEPCERS